MREEWFLRRKEHKITTKQDADAYGRASGKMKKELKKYNLQVKRISNEEENVLCCRKI